MADTYILTADKFRDAHPELASRAWIEVKGDEQFICWNDRLTNRLQRTPLGVPLCTCCDALVGECDAKLTDMPLRDASGPRLAVLKGTRAAPRHGPSDAIAIARKRA